MTTHEQLVYTKISRVRAVSARSVRLVAPLNGKRLGRDHLSAPACARNFRSFHTQRISVALHLAAAEEILDTIMIDRAKAVELGEM